MDTERLMQAVLQSFLDADFRVEVLPRSEDKPSTASTGTGPSRQLYDAATQAADGRHTYKRSSSEPVRMNMGMTARDHVDRTVQAVDGRYASVYKVNHCKVTPTSPPVMTTEFPPQRHDVSYGGDNFQVGGTGSGATGNVPIKSSCYRGGGLNWPNRGAVYAPRSSGASDSFASSLRKYPSVSPERSSEVFERLVNYSMPRTCRSPRCSPHRSPPRETISYRNPKTYEETYAASVRPRAPEDSPTRDKRDDFRKQLHTKQGDIRLIREVSRRLRKTLKSISSYSQASTQKLSSAVDRNQEWCDTPIPETSETDHEPPLETSHPTLCSHPVNTTVQAVASTTSQGVETKLLSSRTIAVPVSPSPSYRLSHRTYNLPDPVTRSVQTEMPRRSVETITSTTELKTRNHVKVVVKKSKSLSDFRLNKGLKGEILAWLDDTNDPKIRDIKDIVLRNLRYRLKGESFTGVEKIKVKLGNCLRRKLHTKHPSSCEFNKKHGFNSNTPSQDEFSAEDTKNETDQSIFEDVIKDWLSDIAIKKRDIFLRPVKRDQIYNTFVNRLKHLVFEKSKQCREELLREEISEILDEVPIEVNNCDKTVYLTKITDNLVHRLGNVIQNKTKTKPLKCNMSDKFNMYLGRSRLMRAEKETKDVLIKAMAEVMKKQNTVNPNTVKPTIVDLVDKLMNSINTNIELEDIANVLHNATKISEKEACQFAAEMIENYKDLNNKYAKLARSQPLAVFMVQHLSRNYIAKTSGLNMSRHSIGSIMDRDVEDNLNQYKTKLAEQINSWLSDLAVFRGNDTNFRQAVVLDLAGDIIDRQKYLEFNKNRGTDVEELEHLKYQIFKWMKRYVGEDNLEALEHAAELMEMIRNIPVPIMNISQFNLNKSNSGICCRGRFEPCTSTDVTNNVYGSKSDSGICNRESQSGLASTYILVDNVDNKKDDLLKKTRQHGPKSSIFNRWNVVINLSNTGIHDNSDLSKLSNNLKNSRASSINKDSVENTNSEDTHSTQDQKTQSTSANIDTHNSQDIPIRYRDNLYKYQSGVSYRDDNFGAALINKSNDEVKSKSNTNYKKKETQNDSILTNYMVHKVSNNKASDLRKQNHQSPSPTRRKIINTNIDSDSTKRSSINKRYSREKHNRSRGSNNADLKSFASIADDNQVPGPSELRTPVPGPSELRSPAPTHSDKQSTASSAAARLMAEWRPPPVFTPPPSGQPLISQVHEDFQEYLKNWCQQIPISANTPEELKTAEKARQGILNGIWKIITKLKTQPSALHNKFYYEDILGKEIDELLDCLPQTEELQEKRYALKAQLLDKYSEMNDMIEELEMPANYKEVLAEKAKQMEDEKFRTVCRTKHDDHSKMYEELFMIAIIDDFLGESNYIETDKVLTKAYKYKLQRTLRQFIDDVKKKHGKEFEQLANNIKVKDVTNLLFTVPLPTDDSIKENADEILIELEIDEWMKHLPLVKNDNETEQRHRIRLRDALTKKIHELEKRGNINDCCGDTQIKHEISVFLDKVPLERDQDLKINEMVEELTNRLKRQAAGGRRKSVAFQEGHLNNSANRSNRLLNRSQLANSNIGPDLRYSTGNEWALQNNEDVDYRDFQNAPLCSTRNEQPANEWAIEEDEDAQYRTLFKNIPASSSMIEPQAGYGEVNAPIPPDFHHSYAETSYFEYNPGQFHESVRGGAFGFPQSPPQHIANKFQYPNLVASHRGSAQSRFYESAADLIPNASISDGQYQSVKSVQYPFNPPPPPNVVWQVPNEAPGFIPMQDDLYGPPDPQMQMSGQHPNMSQRLAASLHASRRSEPPFVEPAPFVPDASRFTRQSNASRSNRTGIDPIMIQEPLEPSFHESQRSRAASRAAMSHLQDSVVLQPNAASGFMSNASHQRPADPIMIQEPLEPSFHESQRSRAASRAAMSHLQDPVILQPNAASGFMSNASYQRPADPIMIQEPLEPSFHESQRSRAASRAEMSHRQDPVAYQPPDEIPAASLETSARCCMITPPAPLETSRGHAASVIHESQRSRAASRAAMSYLQDPVVLQPNAASEFTSIASHPRPGEGPPAPLETSRNQSIQQANEPSIRIHPAHPEFRRSTDREGIQEIINQNRSARSAEDTPDLNQGPVRGTHQVLIHEPPRDRNAEAAAAPSSPQRPDPRNIASNVPSSEISNQPAFYSTPDQRTNLAPPNIRERRQLEKERVPRRVDMDAEDNESEERCHCRERFKRWRMPGPNCTTCDDCVHGGGMEMAWPPMPFAYPPYPYPYMPYGRPPPPYPPHCRR